MNMKLEQLRNKINANNLNRLNSMSPVPVNGGNNFERVTSSATRLATQEQHIKEYFKNNPKIKSLSIKMKLLPFDNGEKVFKIQRNVVKYKDGSKIPPSREALSLNTFICVDPTKKDMNVKSHVQKVVEHNNIILNDMFPSIFTTEPTIDIGTFYSINLYTKLVKDGVISQEEKSVIDIKNGGKTYIVSVLILDNPANPSMNGTIHEIELLSSQYEMVEKYTKDIETKLEIELQKYTTKEASGASEDELNKIVKKCEDLGELSDPFDTNNPLILNLIIDMGCVDKTQVYAQTSVLDYDTLTKEQLEFVQNNPTSLEEVVKNKFKLFNFNNSYENAREEGLTHEQALMRISYHQVKYLLGEHKLKDGTVQIPARLDYFDEIVGDFVKDFVSTTTTKEEVQPTQKAQKVMSVDELKSKVETQKVIEKKFNIDSIEALNDVDDFDESDVEDITEKFKSKTPTQESSSDVDDYNFNDE